MSSTEQTDISALIRKRREKLGMSQQDLANTVGVGINTISNWENGRHDPSRKHRLAIAKALGRSAELGALAADDIRRAARDARSVLRQSAGDSETSAR